MIHFVVLCGLLFINDRVDPQSYEQIEFGMTKHQVEKIFGRRSLGKGIEFNDIWSFYFTVTSSEIRRNGELWQSGTVRIWVVFDENNRVTGKSLSGPITRIKE